MEAEAEEDAKRCYMAQLMWMQTNALYALGGATPEIPMYSEIFGKKLRVKEQTAEEIIDSIIAKAEGGGDNSRCI